MVSVSPMSHLWLSGLFLPWKDSKSEMPESRCLGSSPQPLVDGERKNIRCRLLPVLARKLGGSSTLLPKLPRALSPEGRGAHWLPVTRVGPSLRSCLFPEILLYQPQRTRPPQTVTLSAPFWETSRPHSGAFPEPWPETLCRQWSGVVMGLISLFPFVDISDDHPNEHKLGSCWQRKR